MIIDEPLKFRVWGKKEKAYVDAFEAVRLEIDSSGKEPMARLTTDTDLYEIEMYTGFVDKNGNELFENDLIADEDEKEKEGCFWRIKPGSEGYFGIKWNAHDRPLRWLLEGFDTRISGVINIQEKTLMGNVNQHRIDNPEYAY